MTDFTGLTNALVSHAATLGVFERVNAHEPKNAPGAGISCAIWAQEIGPVPAGSGLASTTGRVGFNVRIYTSMVSEPQDAIDPDVLTAVDKLMTDYSASFTLGGLVRLVDLLGQAGQPLSAQAGYLTIGDKMYRVMTILLPLIINDMWTQSP
jgi:hypothetical protein